MDSHKQGYGYMVDNTGRFLAGLLMGGLIGAGTMLLMAPKSGKETREQIQQQSVELRGQLADTVEDTVAQARGKARQVRAAVRKQAKELGQRGQDMLDEQKDVIIQVVEAEKTAAHNIAKG